MGNVLAFELLYRALVFPLMLWSADRAAALALRLSGYSYVTVGNLAGFLLHPGTILVLLAMAVFAVFLTSLEAACLLEVFQASAYYRREGALKVLLGGFLRLAAELRRKNIGLLLAVSVHGLFINAFMIVQLVRQIKPLNFVLDGMAHEPRAQLALAAVIFALVLAAVPSTFIVFTCMVEQKNFSDGMERSFELYRKRPLRTLAMLVSVNLLAALLTAAFYFLSVVIAAVFAVVFVDRGLELVLLLKLKRNLVLASIWVGSALAMMGNYGALTVIYHRRTARERQNAWEFDFPTGRLLNRKYLLGGLAVVTGLCMTLAWDAFRNGLSMDDGGWSEIAVTAHRGSSKDAPENTMAALETAVEQMADSVEVDVQETRDGVLVLAHDSSLRRTHREKRAAGRFGLCGAGPAGRGFLVFQRVRRRAGPDASGGRGVLQRTHFYEYRIKIPGGRLRSPGAGGCARRRERHAGTVRHHQHQPQIPAPGEGGEPGDPHGLYCLGGLWGLL